MQNQIFDQNKKKIAIIGAGGFVGMRLVEMFLTEEKTSFNIVPIVRSHKSFARISKFGIDCTYADAGNQSQMLEALKNCDVVINLTMGDDSKMVLETKNILLSCEKNCVPLFIQISSAEIYGRNINKNINENYILKKHWMKYANEKYASDEFLKKSFNSEITKIIILRPGLIWGPNSGWVVDPVKSLINGVATLHSNGKGAINLIYIDNLVNIIINFINLDVVKSNIYNIADVEQITWNDYYLKLASCVGIDKPFISYVESKKYRMNFFDIFQIFSSNSYINKLKKKLPNEYKIKTKMFIRGIYSFLMSTVNTDKKISHELSRSQWWLQGTVNHANTIKFNDEFKDFKYISHERAFILTSYWLEFAGYKAIKKQN